MTRSLRAIATVPAMLLAFAGMAWAGVYDSTNGVFGSGSYVGSDHWLAGITQSALIQAAVRGSKRQSAGSAEGLAKEDKAKGYFRIDPAASSKHTPKTGTGYFPANNSPEHPWIPVRADASWKRPVVGTGYSGSATDDSWHPAEADGSWQPPKVDSSWRSPSVGEGYITPGEASLRQANRAIRNRDLDSAMSAYREAAKSDDEAGMSARVSLGIALLGQHRPRDAAHELAIALERNPKDGFVMFMYAASLLFAGDLRGAEAHASACSPRATQGLSCLALGIALDGQGKSAEAIKAYQRYLQWNDLPEVRRRVLELDAAQ